MPHKHKKGQTEPEPVSGELLLYNPTLIEKLMENGKTFGYAGGVIVCVVILALYYGSARSENHMKSAALAAKYAKELAISNVPPEDSQTEAHESQARYEKMVASLEALALEYPDIKERFGGVLTEARLLEPDGASVEGLAAGCVHRLQKADLSFYADFSQAAFFAHEKEI